VDHHAPRVALFQHPVQLGFLLGGTFAPHRLLGELVELRANIDGLQGVLEVDQSATAGTPGLLLVDDHTVHLAIRQHPYQFVMVLGGRPTPTLSPSATRALDTNAGCPQGCCTATQGYYLRP
jgi:hypothetical protein